MINNCRRLIGRTWSASWEARRITPSGSTWASQSTSHSMQKDTSKNFRMIIHQRSNRHIMINSRVQCPSLRADHKWSGLLLGGKNPWTSLSPWISRVPNLADPKQRWPSTRRRSHFICSLMNMEGASYQSRKISTSEMRSSLSNLAPSQKSKKIIRPTQS